MTKGATMTQVADLFRVIGNTQRMMLIERLEDEPRSVNELTSLLVIPQPMVSFHLGRLRVIGAVEVRRRGRHRFYELTACGRVLLSAAKMVSKKVCESVKR